MQARNAAVAYFCSALFTGAFHTEKKSQSCVSSKERSPAVNGAGIYARSKAFA